MHLGLPDAVLGIRLVTDRAMAVLNRKHLKMTGPTDVLSFPMEDKKLLGDIVISLDTAGRQARAAGQTLQNRCLVLVIHGLLHLLGYDHVRDQDWIKMKSKEEELASLLKLKT